MNTENNIYLNSYIKKDDFIKLISELKFVAIKNADIEFITGVIYNGNTQTIDSTVGYKLTII